VLHNSALQLYLHDIAMITSQMHKENKARLLKMLH